jgi:sugar/nucleoside kinase (ribokinase family)
VTDTVTVIGCVQVDLVLNPVADLPPSGATLFVDQMGMRAGGAGANAALALAEVELPPRLIGCIGDDSLGRWMLDQLPGGLTSSCPTAAPASRSPARRPAATARSSPTSA